MATATRVPLCAVDDIPLGLGRGFVVGEESIALFRSRSGRVFAVAGNCPHKGGPLADGMLAGDQVVCPLHAFRFDPSTGACDQPGVCSIPTYEVEVTDGLVAVTV